MLAKLTGQALLRVIIPAAILLIASFYLFKPPSVFGDSASYFYDSLGRLSRVIKGTSGSIYNYDELGNLVSVTSATTSASAPVINEINPDVLFVNSTMLVRISGDNLLATESVTSDNPDLEIDILTVTDSEIMANIFASYTGTATVTVSTPYGSDDTGVSISDSQISIMPAQLALAPGSSGSISVSISPPLPDGVTLNVDNNAPDVVGIPQSLVVPAGSSADLDVTALQEGVATLSLGDSRSVVFVSTPFTDYSTIPARGIVSVRMDAPNDPSPTMGGPVSVRMEAPNDPSPTMGSPVSVRMDAPNDPSPTVSRPVSVGIE